MMTRNCGPSSNGRDYKSVSVEASVAKKLPIRRSSAPQSKSARKRAGGAIALVVGLVLALAGCTTVAVTSSDGVLTATSGTQTTLSWYFFNQDFKEFAAERVPGGPFPWAASEVYPEAIAAEPGIKYFKVRQIIDGFSEVTGSGAATTVLLKANEFANQGDGLKLSATENINLSPPAYGFDWLTGGSATRVTTVVPSDLCGLFVLVLSDDSNTETSDFYDDVVATTDTYDCGSPVPQSASSPGEVEAGPPGISLTVPNAVGRDSAGLPIYFGSHKTSSHGAYSLELKGPQGRTLLASGKSSVYGGYVGTVRLPAGLPGGSYVLSLKNTSAAGAPLVLKVNLTLDANSRLESHSPG